MMKVLFAGESTAPQKITEYDPNYDSLEDVEGDEPSEERVYEAKEEGYRFYHLYEIEDEEEFISRWVLVASKIIT
jgi:hypothetical protein